MARKNTEGRRKTFREQAKAERRLAKEQKVRAKREVKR
jgi:hypothetical protein